jgi:hypothetical protein
MTRLNDIAGFLGGGCLAVGVGMFDVRIALITVGVLLLSLAITGAWRATK